jgi:lipopolysaccharide export system protein LptC
MAELHVQAKKRASSTWIWILVSLIIIAAIAVYILMRDNAVNEKAVSKPSQTSFNMYNQETAII